MHSSWRINWRISAQLPPCPSPSHLGRQHKVLLQRLLLHTKTTTTAPTRSSPHTTPPPISPPPIISGLSPVPRTSSAPSMTSLDAPDLSYSQLAAHVDSVASSLERTGLVRVTLGFPDPESAYLTQLVRSLHARHAHRLPLPHSASSRGGWFWDVRPRPDPRHAQTPGHQARSETMADFPWHSDCSYEQPPPRFFALHVLQHDRCGGGTLSVLAVPALAARLRPKSRAVLARPEFRIAVPAEFVKDGGPGSIRSHILTTMAATTAAAAATTTTTTTAAAAAAAASKEDSNSSINGTLIRFRADIVTPLTPEAAAALADLDAALRDLTAQGGGGGGSSGPSSILHLSAADLPTGSVIMVDNRRWLHARNHVADPERHLRRVRWDASPFPQKE